jgi:hypothetical protein
LDDVVHFGLAQLLDDAAGLERIDLDRILLLGADLRE